MQQYYNMQYTYIAIIFVTIVLLTLADSQVNPLNGIVTDRILRWGYTLFIMVNVPTSYLLIHPKSSDTSW